MGVVADAFYEWKKLANRKQPYYFQLQDNYYRCQGATTTK
ncbi:MAG: SOS response-associated peptidase family protein [Cyanobacteria bacterium J06632_19]